MFERQYIGPPVPVTATAYAAQVGLEEPLGSCVAQAFVDEHGGRLPNDLAEFCQWANATGRRQSDGTWTCIPAEASANGTQGTGQPTGPSLALDWTNLSAKARAWVYSHPWLTLGIGAGLWLALGFDRSVFKLKRR